MSSIGTTLLWRVLSEFRNTYTILVCAIFPSPQPSPKMGEGVKQSINVIFASNYKLVGATGGRPLGTMPLAIKGIRDIPQRQKLLLNVQHMRANHHLPLQSMNKDFVAFRGFVASCRTLC